MEKNLDQDLEKKLQFAMEEERLKATIEVINEEILKCIDKRKQIMDIILEYRKNMLEDYKDDEDRIIEYFDHESYVKEESFRVTDRKLRELTILKNSPYFAKVTFREDDFGIEDIYIGRFGITLEDTFDQLVVDWRAPVSAIFYNGTGDSAEYDAPEGKVSVSVLDRVQYIIKKEKLEGVFKSALNVKDDILQMVLSKNSSDKLKDIVMTIQKEQDEIIRQEKNKIIVVDGVAGSGKTTIALHRVAYLIYNYRKLLEDKVLILGPNRIFIDYISNVLPTLGETGVYQTTFIDLALELTDVDDVMDIKEVMERILNGDEKFLKEVSYKRSERFKTDLDKFIDEIENSFAVTEDMTFEYEIVSSKEEINQMLRADFINMPLFRRTRKIKRILFAKLKDVRDKKFREIQMALEEEKAKLTKEELLLQENNMEFMRRIKIRELISKVMDAKKKLKYLDGEKVEKLYENFNGGSISYTEEDLVAILYLKVKLNGLILDREIKHLVIDEAQDYSMLQFEVMKSLVDTKSMTIVGDSNQQLIPSEGQSSIYSIPKVFGDENVEFFRLSKSYRSTNEIMEYSNRYIDDISIIPMVRDGAPVEEFEVSDKDKLKEKIISSLEKFKAEGLENIAIVAKDLTEAEKIYEVLSDEENIKLMERENVHGVNGVMVIPSYYAKGLEFDGCVVVADNSFSDYRNLMYIMCTRALHRLTVIKYL